MSNFFAFQVDSTGDSDDDNDDNDVQEKGKATAIKSAWEFAMVEKFEDDDCKPQWRCKHCFSECKQHNGSESIGIINQSSTICSDKGNK